LKKLKQLGVGLLGGLLLVGLPSGLRAQENSKSLGFVQFDTTGLFDDEDIKVDVSVRGALLSLLVEATKEEDSEFSKLVSKLESIRVQVFSFQEGKLPQIQQKFSSLAKALDDEGWERVVRVRERGERVDTYLRTVDNHIAGLVVLVVDPKDEAIFVNIVGEIDPAQIGRIGRKLRIHPLEGLGSDDDEDKETRVRVTISDDKEKERKQSKDKSKESTKDKDVDVDEDKDDGTRR
jgi:hypothetical protein